MSANFSLPPPPDLRVERLFRAARWIRHAYFGAAPTTSKMDEHGEPKPRFCGWRLHPDDVAMCLRDRERWSSMREEDVACPDPENNRVFVGKAAFLDGYLCTPDASVPRGVVAVLLEWEPPTP